MYARLDASLLRRQFPACAALHQQRHEIANRCSRETTACVVHGLGDDGGVNGRVLRAQTRFYRRNLLLLGHVTHEVNRAVSDQYLPTDPAGSQYY